MPKGLPVFQTLSTAIALDFWNAPGWLWGALGFMFFILWIAVIYNTATQESVDLLGNDN